MATISNKVRYFASTMAEAPTLSGAAGALIAVLDACLVNGFGNKSVDSIVVTGGIATANISSGHDFAEGDVLRFAGATPAGMNSDWRLSSVTPNSVTWSVEGCGVADGTATGAISALRAPAGWEKVFADGTTRAAYRSLRHADHNGVFLLVTDTGTTTARARGFESMSDIDNGMGPFPTDTQVSGGLWWAKANDTAGARPWNIAADDKRFSFSPRYHTAYPYAAPAFCFGKLKPITQVEDDWATILTGCTTSARALFSLPGDTVENGLPTARSTSTGEGLGFLARSAAGAQSIAAGNICPAFAGISQLTGSSAFGARSPSDEIFATETMITDGVTGAALRGYLCGPTFMLASLSLSAAPGGTKVGAPGNGAIVLWRSANSSAWLLSLGKNGRWD